MRLEHIAVGRDAPNEVNVVVEVPVVLLVHHPNPHLSLHQSHNQKVI